MTTEKLSHPGWYGSMELLPVIFLDDPAIDALVQKHVIAAIVEERERCAKLADLWAAEYHIPPCCSEDIRTGKAAPAYGAEPKPFRRRR